MNVVYTAPNRGHHYRYAAALQAAGCLRAFVSGFPRLNPRAKAPGLQGHLHHADLLQTVYVAGLKAGLPTAATNWLALAAKLEQDHACRRFMPDCDIFLCYSGSGLGSMSYRKTARRRNIVEAVNSHVEYQETLLREEHAALGLPWTPFPEREKNRRLAEYERADYILLPSEFVRRSFLAKGFPAGKLLKVPFGFDAVAARPAAPRPAGEAAAFTVLYVGSLSLRKGIRYLVEAFGQLRHPRKRLLLVGPDVHDGALTGLTLPADVTLAGVLKGDELAQAYQAADVFCLPSIEEGQALVLGEALSFGLPIVATANTGADDLITDGEEGYLVPIRSSEAIRQRLQELADDPARLHQLSGRSQARASQLDGWQQTGENLVQTLRNVYADALT